MIDEDGKNLGTMETAEALRLAQERGLDLIEIAPTANPPVCRIMDFGKFKYDREKGEREHGKKQKEVEVKGIRVGFTTGKHDLELRARQAQKFLSAGDKVRIDMRLHGREKAHGNLAFQKLNEFLEMIGEYNLEMPPKRFPQGFIAIISKNNNEKGSIKKN
ncbi:MAG: translation initiation factor IF-3 [Candidatus Sungbacteria bacterium]|nr:translation initiation factor IF-3 [Candidatus Sungbacteria bacterium]